MKTETITTADFSMDYFTFGHGRQPLVILPGISLSRVMKSKDLIAGNYSCMNEQFTVYVFERRNEMPPVYPIVQMGEDTAEAMNVLGLSQVCLFGASQGGMMALEIAIRHPELVHKLMIGSSVPNIGPVFSAKLDKWVHLAKAGDAGALYLSFGEDVYPGEVFEQSRQLILEAAKDVTQEDLKRFMICAEDRSFDMRNELPNLKCPLFVANAEDDQVLGSDVRPLVSAPALRVGINHIDDGAAMAVNAHCCGPDSRALAHELAAILHVKGVEQALQVALDTGLPQRTARSIALHVDGLDGLAAQASLIDAQFHLLGALVGFNRKSASAGAVGDPIASVDNLWYD